MTHNKKDRKENEPGLFYAKILLFGEYSVIFDSMALTIPFSHFTAGFSFLNRNKYTDYDLAVRSNTMLKEYGDWLAGDESPRHLKTLLSTSGFLKDIVGGMYLESNIPQGYGLGSSGALCAAVYDRYAVNRISNDVSAGHKEMVQLKSIFASMESWFHGTSSGLDPLSCYFGRPVLVSPGEGISIAGIPEYDGNKVAAIFLVDTGLPGKTGPLVNLFMEKASEKGFMDMVNDTMIPAVNKCIGSMISGDLPLFLSGLKKLSLFQLEYMKPMIPADFLGVWERGLASGDYLMKLCGSGGGGYLLGFTRDMEKTAAILSRENIDVLAVTGNSPLPGTG